MARPIVLIPHLFWLAGEFIFGKDYSPPLVRRLDPSTASPVNSISDHPVFASLWKNRVVPYPTHRTPCLMTYFTDVHVFPALQKNRAEHKMVHRIAGPVYTGHTCARLCSTRDLAARLTLSGTLWMHGLVPPRWTHQESKFSTASVANSNIFTNIFRAKLGFPK